MGRLPPWPPYSRTSSAASASLAQEFASSLATSLMPASPCSAPKSGYAVLPTAKFDGDAASVLYEFNPLE